MGMYLVTEGPCRAPILSVGPSGFLSACRVVLFFEYCNPGAVLGTVTEAAGDLLALKVMESGRIREAGTVQWLPHGQGTWSCFDGAGDLPR